MGQSKMCCTLVYDSFTCQRFECYKTMYLVEAHRKFVYRIYDRSGR